MEHSSRTDDQISCQGQKAREAEMHNATSCARDRQVCGMLSLPQIAKVQPNKYMSHFKKIKRIRFEQGQITLYTIHA